MTHQDKRPIETESRSGLRISDSAFDFFYNKWLAEQKVIAERSLEQI